MKVKEENAPGQLGNAVGKGILAGLAGVAAMTISQMIEMRVTGRSGSDAPSKAVAKVADIKPTSEAEKEKVNNEIHWTYGTILGVTRGLISLTGLSGFPATLLHFGVVWGSSLVMLPALKISPPITEEEPKSIAVDAFHHAIYALVTGFAYDALDAGGRHERKLNRLVEKLRVKGVLNNIQSKIVK